MATHGLQLRPYKADDQSQVVVLWREVFADDPPWNEPSAVIERKLRVQPELFLVAHIGSEILGTILAGFDGVRGWIHHLAVHPCHRRNGIGTLLMRAAEKGLLQMGCPKVNLQVRGTNKEVIAFYQTLVYQVEERASLGKRLGAA